MLALFPWFDDVTHRASYDVPWIVSVDAPATLEAATEYYRRTGRVCVSDAFCDRTIFARSDTNIAFRAWHDWHHIRLQAPFNREGEAMVATAQLGDCLRLMPADRWLQSARVLECEILGQFDYQAETGRFPDDQRAFTREYFSARNWSI